MNQEKDLQFTELVRRQLLSDEEVVRSLWLPAAESFDRDGPEAVNKVLEAEQQRLEERVRTLLSEFESE